MMARLRYKDYRGVINGKAGKAAALPRFSDMLTHMELKVKGKFVTTSKVKNFQNPFCPILEKIKF